MANSSTRKAAKLAQKGRGQAVRFQGGTVFPIAVALTLILGLGLIVYARQSLPADDESPPTINDHWHAAYGFYLCDGWVQLNGDLEELDSRGQLVNVDFLRTGIHSHNDGIIHWHPYNSPAVGKNAVLDVFLENYGVELDDDQLTFASEASIQVNPSDPTSGPSEMLTEYIEGETTCDGEDAELAVRAWGAFTDTDGGSRYVRNMGDIHVDNDAMVFAIYFTADGIDEAMPPWAQDLPTLGESDQGTEINPDITDLDSPRLQNDTDPADTTGDDSGVSDDDVPGDESGEQSDDGAGDEPADTAEDTSDG